MFCFFRSGKPTSHGVDYVGVRRSLTDNFSGDGVLCYLELNSRQKPASPSALKFLAALSSEHSDDASAKVDPAKFLASLSGNAVGNDGHLINHNTLFSTWFRCK